MEAVDGGCREMEGHGGLQQAPDLGLTPARVALAEGDHHNISSWLDAVERSTVSWRLAFERDRGTLGEAPHPVPDGRSAGEGTAGG